jgi:hypothetical protein
MTDPLDAIRARAAELEHRRETADDPAEAARAADELHQLMDNIDNVRELPRRGRS